MSERSRFQTRLRFRPQRYTSRSAPVREPETRTIGPARALQRPLRFAVGLDVFGAHSFPRDRCLHAPLDPAMYLGRVEEVGAHGTVTVHLWEYPNGRESTAVLSLDDLNGHETHPGASLRIWTWLEWPDDQPEPIPRQHIEVRNKTLSETDRDTLARLIAELSGTPEEAT